MARTAVRDLARCEISNHDLLDAIGALAFSTDGHSRQLADYKNLGSEELGSVYESLLELPPILNVDAGAFELKTAGGHERKTTGSYDTPTSLILIDLTHILSELFGQVVIPLTVLNELQSPQAPDAVREWCVHRPDWLVVRGVR